MSKRIRIDHPGDGEWVMSRAGGSFRPDFDHVLASYRSDDDELLGAFVFTDYLGGSICVHMAGTAPGWATRELLAMAFDYGFNQLRVFKMFAPVPSDNHEAMALNLRAGWRVAAALSDALGRGRHLMVLEMTRDNCPWLRLSLRQYARGYAVEEADSGR